jgi:hypothetical protein
LLGVTEGIAVERLDRLRREQHHGRAARQAHRFAKLEPSGPIPAGEAREQPLVVGVAKGDDHRLGETGLDRLLPRAVVHHRDPIGQDERVARGCEKPLAVVGPEVHDREAGQGQRAGRFEERRLRTAGPPRRGGDQSRRLALGQQRFRPSRIERTLERGARESEAIDDR